MKALVIHQPGQASLIDWPTPSVGPDDVLLRTRRVGFCGTDLNTYRGANPLVAYPRIPGHEIAATIEEVGANVPQTWQIRQDVLVIPYTSCGVCSACRQSRFNCCRENQTLGVQRDGGMAERFVVPCTKLLTTDSLSLQELALVEPLTIGFHAIERGRVKARDTVAVLGCGMIGLGVIAGAARRGARVIAVDIDPAKLNIATKCGAWQTINSRDESLTQRIRDITAGQGPEVVVEAVGHPDTFLAAVEIASFAGRVVYIGYSKAPVEYETKYFVLKELDILGSRNALASDFATVIGHIKEKGVPVAEIVTHTVPLQQACEMLRQWNNHPEQFVKIHVDFDQ